MLKDLALQWMRAELACVREALGILGWDTKTVEKKLGYSEGALEKLYEAPETMLHVNFLLLRLLARAPAAIEKEEASPGAEAFSGVQRAGDAALFGYTPYARLDAQADDVAEPTMPEESQLGAWSSRHWVGAIEALDAELDGLCTLAERGERTDAGRLRGVLEAHLERLSAIENR